MRNCRKQYNNGNVVQCKENVDAFQIKEEKLLAKDKILPDSARDEGVKAVSAGQGMNYAECFCAVCHAELVSASLLHEILKQVQDDSC